jgi:hypothetical protein
MSLLTVRLSAEDKKLVQSLRAEGVPIADVVRTALRTEHERRHRRPLKSRQVVDLIARIEAANPVPEGGSPARVDTLDRNAVRGFIGAKLKNKRRR